LRDARRVRIEREHLIAELQRRVEEDDALVEVGRIVGRLRDPAEVVPAVLEASRKGFRFERATVFTIDEARGEYRAIYRLSQRNDGGPAPSFKLGEGLVAAALEADRPLLVRDVLADPRYVPRHLRERRRSVILVPLRVGGRPVAVLSLSRGLPDAFAPEDLRQAEIVAAYVGQVLENERLFREASQAEALRAADRMKDEFLATVSHELRTPLTIVRGALEILRRGVARPEQLIDQALRNVERLSRTVQDLIDLAQLREARVELERVYVPARELLEEAAQAHGLLATQRGQRLVVDGAMDLPLAYVDRARMLQVLGNVVSNAIRYGPLETPITLSCECESEELRFRVVDRGPGVPAAERERIFDRFYRGEATRDIVSGSGLGLAIARRLIELHGGRIWVEDADPGSAFVIALPLEAPGVEAAS
jgi:signal transduction histidine kinase